LQILVDENMKRREMFQGAAAYLLAGAERPVHAQSGRTFTQFLEASAVPRSDIDRFLRGPSWARFDPLLGYVPGNYMPADGMDKSSTISTVQRNGARTSFLYAGRPCRINSYGDSFTHGDQVNDGETWQEYLAGHLGEPVRNFGVGGYGVYQSYLRMKREESTSHSAQYVIFYIWGDDHIRSLLRCRHAIIYPRWNDRGGAMFHANFWTHVEMNFSTGEFEERPNVLNTPEALYRMTEPEFMVRQLQDDVALQLYAVALGHTTGLDAAAVNRLASRFGYAMQWSDASQVRRQAQELLDRYAIEATRFTLAKVREFARQNGKKLLVVLFDPRRALTAMIRNETRYDQPVVDYLQKEHFDYFDMNEVHVQDFARYRISFEEYMKLYFIGHYNPRGNHFFAYAIKDKIVNWLDPRPIPYLSRDPETVDFEQYLNAGSR
jgi:hypothetical protein